MPAAQAGVASAVASTSRQVGQTLGIAVMGAVAGASGGQAFGPGFAAATHPVWWMIAGLGLLVLGIGLLTTSEWARGTARATASLLTPKTGGLSLASSRVQERVSLVTFGVVDLHARGPSTRLIGWSARAGPDDDVVFFQAGGMILGLWSRASLAEDSVLSDSGGFGGITLAHNVGSPEQVDGVIAEARQAGAKIAREPATTFWGGYSGLFHDLDGHPWEVAHNPHWTLDPDGQISL